jgi:DNA-binding MarR family transcriptional regulator
MNQADRTWQAADLWGNARNDSFLVALALTGHVLRAAFESFVGVPMSRLRLLAAMYAGGELSQADLQRQLEVDGATITRRVKQMEAEGLLQRRADPKDNRFTLVALTAAGRETVEALVRRGRDFEQLAVQDIGAEELAAATAALARMRHNLRSIASEDWCPQSRGDGDTPAR